jgi:hypothetical protein
MRYYFVILFILLFFCFCSNRTSKTIDKIEKIELTFTNDNWWHTSFIKINKDSIRVFISKDDSIGRISGILGKPFLNLIDTLLKNVPGNFIDTNYRLCDKEAYHYKIELKREKSKIYYYGGCCRNHEHLDKFVYMLIDIISQPNFETELIKKNDFY